MLKQPSLSRPLGSLNRRHFIATITPVETGHHSAIPGHLGLISMLTGRKIRWSVEHEKIIGDADASKLLTRPYRAPWHLA
jgi:hypothetical protein